MAEDDSFSDDEVALILHRAAEMQPGRTTSLAEIEVAAAEAGIEGALVRRAANELRRPPPAATPAPSSSPFGPTQLVFERSIPWVLGPNDHARVLAEIRHHLPVSGKAEHFDDELIWSSKQRAIRVSVTPRKDTHETLVRVVERTGGLTGGLYGGIMGGVGGAGLGWVIPVCIVVLGAPILIPVLFAAWVYASYLFARSIQRSVLTNRREQLEALTDGLAEIPNKEPT